MKMRFSVGILLVAVLMCSMAVGALAQEQVRAFLRRPDIHGDLVVFTAEGDLWLGSIRTHRAHRITSHPGVEIYAHFSPDGRRIAFTGQYDGGTDIYVMSVDGGAPMRLTFDPAGGARCIGWTPDGKDILFRSRRENPEGRNRLWKVSASGGRPVLLPIPQVEHAAMNQDGHRVAYVPVSAEWQHWFHYKGGQADDVWLADIEKKTFTRLTDWPGVDTTPCWVGNDLYFISERSGVANLYRLDVATRRVFPATHYTDYEVRYPSSDGKRIIFQHGNGLGIYDPATGASSDLVFDLDADRIHARPRRVPAAPAMNSAAIGPTGKRVVIEARGQILSVPAEHGDVRVLAPLPGSRSQYPVWSPDGKQIAFVSDRSGEDQVWVCAADGSGTPRQLTKDHKGPLDQLVWSPDGKWIAVGDREQRIMLVDVATGAVTLVAQGTMAGTYDDVNTSYRFSPDGKWLTYTLNAPNWNSVVYLYDIAGKKAVPVTSSEMSSYAPAFDTGGKYLVFLQDRQFDPIGGGASHFFFYDRVSRVSLVPLAASTPSPFLPEDDEEGATPSKPAETPKAPTQGTLPAVKVDLEGISGRIVDVPMPTANYQQVECVDGRILATALNDLPRMDQPDPGRQLVAYDLKKRQYTQLLGRLSGFEVSANHSKLLIENGKDLYIVDANTGPFTLGSGKVALDGIMLNVDPPAEWRQIFAEAWRIARDFFYDPNMHGLDWAAVRRKYEAWLPAVADRSDLNIVLGDMIAELNTGHAYVGGGDMDMGAPSVPMGYLGADLEAVPGANAYRIVRLLAGDGFDLSSRSPLLAPGVDVKPGDYILAVAGQPVRQDQDIQALLIGTAGHTISLTVNSKPTMDGARVVRVVPMASEAKARYYEWVAMKREYVRRQAGDAIGYIHIPDMGTGGLQEFTKHYYSNLNRDALIYDVRNNGGGYVSGMLLLQMASKPVSYSQPRYGHYWSRQDWGFRGYAAALCNENSGSDAEWFSDMFQRLKLGPVIGVHSWGGLVGSGGGYPLIDGGRIYIPNYGAWYDGKWVVEGTGATPDITVENDPADVLAGKDPQLDRAIAYLKEKLAKEPLPKLQHPPYPVKAGRN